MNTLKWMFFILCASSTSPVFAGIIYFGGQNFQYNEKAPLMVKVKGETICIMPGGRVSKGVNNECMKSLPYAKSPHGAGLFESAITNEKEGLNTMYYSDIIQRYADKYGISHHLVRAIIHVESGFRRDAVSPKGARGLMQLIPSTFSRYTPSNANPFNPEDNIAAGVAYLDFLMKKFNYNPLNAIAAYNAGEGAVEKYQGIPPYKETQNYVKEVITLWGRYARGV